MPIEAAPRSIATHDVLDLAAWLGVPLAPHQDYFLRVVVGGQVEDVGVMVNATVCDDVMLPPPVPPGMIPACISESDGSATATYLPSASAALDAASTPAL